MEKIIFSKKCPQGRGHQQRPHQADPRGGCQCLRAQSLQQESFGAVRDNALICKFDNNVLVRIQGKTPIVVHGKELLH